MDNSDETAGRMDRQILPFELAESTRLCGKHELAQGDGAYLSVLA